jgi:hypothetical protein
MLQAMERKVREQGEKEQELFDKFMCYCKTGVGSLEKSIADAETKIPALKADIESSSEQVEESKETLKQEQAERESTKQAVDEATALREKEAAAYASEKDEYTANIAAIKKAVASIEKGVAGSLLQTDLVATIRGAVAKERELLEEDRDEVLAFLSGGQGQSASYVPQSGQIVGILKQMGDTMEKNLADATEQEQEAIKTYESLMAAKKKELEALQSSIESKTKKIGELNVAVVEMKADLADTADSLAEDQAFAKELEKGCSTKQAEWAERQKTRSEELLAISDTIKTLNDDDALELFKKTLPSASASSFVQIQVSAKALVRRARSAIKRAQLRAANRHRAKIDLISLALSGKKVEFTKVLKLIDDMVGMLQKEQVDDEKKKEYCEAELDAADDKKKAAENALEDANHNKESCKAGIATLAEEIATLIEGIKVLDKEVADQTQQRKAENTEYNELLSSNSAAKELLKIAINRLNKFYNPKMYVPPAKKELGAVDAVARDFNVALVQVSESRSEVDPGSPPDTFGEYKKTSQENTGVIQMINTLIKSLDLDMTEAKAEEKNAQEEYELFIKDSAGKRQADTKAVADKEESKANLEADLEEYKAAMVSAYKDLEATGQYISSLHAQCDFLLNFFEVRKKARAGEIGALQDAKAVLSGADSS